MYFFLFLHTKSILQTMKKIITLLSLLCITINLNAQNPILQNFSNVEYRGGTQNWGVDITPDNRVVFANNNGLLIYDSDRWSIHTVPNYTNVRSTLFSKKDNVIYAGATNEFGFFKGNDCFHGISYHSLSNKLPQKYRIFGEIWKILRIDDEIAFQSKNAVFILHPNGKITTHSFKFDIENATAIDNRLYISSKESILVYQNGRIFRLPGSETLAGKAVAAVLPFRKGQLFLTVTDGIYMYEDGKMKPYELDITPILMSQQVFCAEIHDDYLAIGTVRGGLVVKNMRTGRNTFTNTLTGLQNNTVLSMHFDEIGNLWLGLDNGIAYVMLNTPFYNLYGISNNIGTGYASLRDNDNLYLATNQGLFLMALPLPNNSATPPQTQPVSGINGQVWSCRKIGNDVLVGANDGAFTVKGTAATRIPGLRGTWGFIPLRGHDGLVLGCDYNGLVIAEGANGSYKVRNRIAGGNISTGLFMQDADGSIWLSHWKNGIYRIMLNGDLTKVTKKQVFNKGTGLPLDNDNLICKIRGRIYVSSVDGFRQYNSKTGKLEKCDRLNKIFNTYGMSLRIIETPSGNLWAYKPDYLAIAERKKNGSYTVKRMEYTNIVKRLQMSLGHIGFIDNDHTLLSYDNGFYIVGNSLQENKSPKNSNKLIIREIHSTNSNDTLIYASHYAQKTDEITVPHSLNSLRIEFVMPEYRDQNGVEYSCYMENYDKQWVGPQLGTTKEYTQLSKGTYIFHVKARNLMDGTERETSISIRVLPAWYETWWAYIIYIVAVVILGRMLIKRMKENAEKELKRMKIEQERQIREQEQQMREQQLRFKVDEEQREKEIIKLRNGQLEIELKHKSGELADNAINLVRKNDMLQAIDTEMEELYKSVRTDADTSAIKKKVSDIRRNIHTHMTDDSNWDKFEENFNLVYDNFTQKLMEQFPDLKKNDLKLCVYLRMGLSSKEMASLLNTSVRSIETARYRLRKKLSIGSGDNLLEFISEIDKK